MNNGKKERKTKDHLAYSHLHHLILQLHSPFVPLLRRLDDVLHVLLHVESISLRKGTVKYTQMALVLVALPKLGTQAKKIVETLVITNLRR